MTAAARDVAAAIRERLPGVPIKKLHKLLYYCQGHHLAQFGTPLFAEAIVAFDMGPVVQSLWREEKYGPPPAEYELGPALGEAELNTIGYVVSRYGRWSGRELEIQTHGELPWQHANEGRRPGQSAPIPNESIREYFRASERADQEEDPVPLDPDTVRQALAGADGVEPATVRPDRRDELIARLKRG